MAATLNDIAVQGMKTLPSGDKLNQRSSPQDEPASTRRSAVGERSDDTVLCQSCGQQQPTSPEPYMRKALFDRVLATNRNDGSPQEPILIVTLQ